MAGKPGGDDAAKQLLAAMGRRRRLIAVTTVVTTLAVTAATVTAPRVYQADARLVVGVSRESIGLDPTFTGPPRLPVFQSRDYEINQQIAELQSRAQEGRVVDVLGPRYVLGQTDELMPEARALLSNGASNPARDSASAGAAVGGAPDDPASPATTRPDARGSAGSVIAEELKRLGLTDRVGPREQAVARFEQSFQVRSEYNSNVLFLSYRDSTPRRAQDILTAALRLHVKSKTEDTVSATSYDFFRDQIARLEAQVAGTQQRLEDMRRRYGVVSIDQQKSLLIQRIGNLEDARDGADAEIAATRASVSFLKSSLSTGLAGEQATLESLLAKRAKLAAQIGDLKDRLDVVSGVEFQVRQLESDVQTQQGNLARYRDNLELARINRALDREQLTNLTVLQDPNPPETKVSPKTTQNVALGLIVGLLLGAGLAFAREQLDHTLKTARDAKAALGVPAVLALPLVSARYAAAACGRRGGAAARKTRKAVLAGSIASWFEHLPDTRETFVQLRDELVPITNSPPFVLAVLSCGREEGVSTVSSGIAYSVAALEGQRVLLVDANLHHPDGERALDAERPPGHVDTLALRDFARHAASDGALAPRVAASRAPLWSDAIAALRPGVESDRHTMIVLDLPAADEGPATLRAAARADGALLVVSAGKVPRERALSVKERVEKMGGRMLAVVLNRQPDTNGHAS